MLILLYRGTASKILDAYYAKIGGKEALFSSLKEKKAAVKNPKKRRRESTSTSTPQTTNGAKRGRKNNSHPSSTTPPASANYSGFKPPTGSWEEEVTGIDACEGTEGKVVVYLTWASGAKSQHPLSQVYKRCPQKVWHKLSNLSCESVVLTGPDAQILRKPFVILPCCTRRLTE
jgi:chromobox protein 1